MYTAKTSIPVGGNWPTGYYLYTNPSGSYSNIKDIKMTNYGSGTQHVELMELYPTDTVIDPSFVNFTSGIITKVSCDHNIENVRIRTLSNLGSQIKVRSSGQVDVFVNYQVLDQEAGRWPGINIGMENGRLW